MKTLAVPIAVLKKKMLIADARCANDFQARGDYVNGGTAEVLSTSEVWGVSGTATYELSEAVTLKSITAYRSTTSRGIRDADNTPFLIITTDVGNESEQLSKELQLQYDGDQVSKNGTSSPAFVISPYGEVYFAENPRSPPPGYPSYTTFPDGTTIPNAVITDPCRNPF